MFENQKKNLATEDIFYINLYRRDRLNKEFTAFYGDLTPEEALTSFTVSDV